MLYTRLLFNGLNHYDGRFFRVIFKNFLTKYLWNTSNFFHYLLYTFENASNFFCPKKYKTHRVKPLRAFLWFLRTVGWLIKMKNMVHYLYCISFRLTKHFYFFYFWRREKNSWILHCNLHVVNVHVGPKLHVDNINNY